MVGKGIRKGIVPPKPEINFYRITCQPNLDKFLRGFYFLKQILICRKTPESKITSPTGNYEQKYIVMRPHVSEIIALM